MSTRGIFGVRIDGKDKIGYNHSDSYPSGLGNCMIENVKELLKTEGMEGLKTLARGLKLVDNDDESYPSKTQRKKLSKFVENVEDRNWYDLLRNLQGELSKTLYAGFMVDGSGFINDSLFCEWGYIVNLDEEVLEVYKGFQKKKHNLGRYADNPAEEKCDTAFYPCALVKTYPLDKLPKKVNIPDYEE